MWQTQGKQTDVVNSHAACDLGGNRAGFDGKRVLFHCLFISSETGKQSNNLLLRPSLASYFISHFNPIVNVALLIRHTLTTRQDIPSLLDVGLIMIFNKKKKFLFLSSPSFSAFAISDIYQCSKGANSTKCQWPMFFFTQRKLSLFPGNLHS